MHMNCKYRKCCCQNDFNEAAIEKACSDVGTVAEFCDQEKACQCGFDEEYNPFPSNPMLGQSYVPFQTMNTTFTPCVGLKMGTIYPELVSPYMPNQSMEEIAFIEATNEIGKGCNKC